MNAAAVGFSPGSTGLYSPTAPPTQTGLVASTPTPVSTGLVAPSGGPQASPSVSGVMTQWAALQANAFTPTAGLGGSSLFNTAA